MTQLIPRHAMHVYAHNDQCDQWNNFMLQSLPGPIITSTPYDTKKITLHS